MSLIKLPFIFVTNVGFHHTFTAPSTGTKGEKKPVTNFWGWVIDIMLIAIPTRKMIWYSLGVVEAAAILANRYPSWPLSKFILPTLLPYNNPLDLRLTPISAIGTLLIAGGTILRKFCYRAMHRFFTFDVNIRKDHELITTGPYAVVRHPSYSGILAVYIGMFCWYGSRGSWLRECGVLDTAWGRGLVSFMAVAEILVLVALLKRMSFEDAALKENFGETWTKWARKVPYSLIPWVY